MLSIDRVSIAITREVNEMLVESARREEVSNN